MLLCASSTLASITAAQPPAVELTMCASSWQVCAMCAPDRALRHSPPCCGCTLLLISPAGGSADASWLCDGRRRCNRALSVVASLSRGGLARTSVHGLLIVVHGCHAI